MPRGCFVIASVQLFQTAATLLRILGRLAARVCRRANGNPGRHITKAFKT
jgi:hypothetical protein